MSVCQEAGILQRQTQKDVHAHAILTEVKLANAVMMLLLDNANVSLVWMDLIVTSVKMIFGVSTKTMKLAAKLVSLIVIHVELLEIRNIVTIPLVAVSVKKSMMVNVVMSARHPMPISLTVPPVKVVIGVSIMKLAANDVKLIVIHREEVEDTVTKTPVTVNARINIGDLMLRQAANVVNLIVTGVELLEILIIVTRQLVIAIANTNLMVKFVKPARRHMLLESTVTVAKMVTGGWIMKLAANVVKSILRLLEPLDPRKS